MGQQQKVALARALAPSPRVILADEPFSSLDFHARGELQTIFQRALGPVTGVTALLVSHSIEDAVFMGDRVIVLSPMPTHVVTYIDIPGPRPRTGEFRRSEVFYELCSAATKAFLQGDGA